MSAITQRGTKGVGHGIELVCFGRCLGVAEIEILHALHWHDMEVDVRYLEAGDHQSDSFALHDRPLRFANSPGHFIEMLSGGIVEIEPVINFLPRDNQDVAWVKRSNIEHGNTCIVGPDQPTGNLACDDATENRRHGPDGK